jgi:hypothetical protein
MASRRTIALVAGLVAVLAPLAPTALGGQHKRPIARIACASNAVNCSESGMINLPADSFGSQSTDTTPSGSSSADSVLSASDLPAFDSMWEGVVEAYPKLTGVKNIFVKRTITCVIFARTLDFGYASFTGSKPQSAEIASGTIYVLALQACLKTIVAAQMPVMLSTNATGARSGCDKATVSVPILLERAGTGFKAQITGPPAKATGRQPVAVSCSPTSHGLKLAFKPTARGRKLRSVVGPKLSIAFGNPSNKPVTVSTKYTFR